jgi:polysaccharide biosynthesis protein PslH
MNILVVSSYLPYPLYSGGQVRLYNLIKELSAKHTITLVCERRPHETDQDIAEVKKICKDVITVPRKKQWSIQNILNAGMSQHSFLITGHTLPKMQEVIGELLRVQKFDLIHVETFYVMQNVPQTAVPIVLVEHNVEYQVYERFKEKAPPIARPLLSLDIAKIRKEEESFWKKAAKVVVVSKDDQTIIQEAGIRSEVVANGVNTNQFELKNIEAAIKQKDKKILFIGDYKWMQNRDSAAFIIKEVWPLIKAKHPTVTLWFVARAIPDSIRELTKDPRIIFDEQSSAKPTEEIFQEASVLLAPIRVGGGTSYKILESMSCGTPVITMPLSANALQAKDGVHLLVGESSTTLAQKTVQVLKDDVLYKHVSVSGRTFIEAHYTWKQIAKVLDSVYYDAVS